MTGLTTPPMDSEDHADITGLARRGLMSLGGSAVSAIVNLLVIVVVTRGVGQSIAGQLFSATSLFVVLESVGALGTATGLVYFIARVRAQNRQSLVASLIGRALRVVVPFAICMGGGLFVLADPLKGLMGADTGDNLAALFIRLIAIFLPCAIVYDALIAATQGFHTMTPTVVLERLARPISQLVLLLAATMLGLGWTLPIAWAGPYLVVLGLVVLAVRRLMAGDKKLDTTTGPGIRPREFWTYTAPRGLASVAQLSLQRLDIVLVAALVGAEAAAIYTAATRFVVLGQLGSQAVSLAVQPKFSELLARGDLETTRHVYQTSTAWVIAVTWPIHLVVAVLAPFVLQLFGHGYQSGTWVVIILAASMLVATGCGMVTMLLVMAGRTRANLFNVLVALGTNLGLNFLLIPYWGIEGAAIAWATAIVLANLLPLYQIHRGLGLSPFSRASGLVAGMAIATLCLFPALGWFFGSEVTVVVLAAVGLIAYACGIWKLRRTLELEALVGSVQARLRRRR